MRVGLAVSPIIGLVFHSAFVGGMNAEFFSDFLIQARLNLDQDETVIFIYDGATAHNSHEIQAQIPSSRNCPSTAPSSTL